MRKQRPWKLSSLFKDLLVIRVRTTAQIHGCPTLEYLLLHLSTLSEQQDALGGLLEAGGVHRQHCSSFPAEQGKWWELENFRWLVWIARMDEFDYFPSYVLKGGWDLCDTWWQLLWFSLSKEWYRKLWCSLRVPYYKGLYRCTEFLLKIKFKFCWLLSLALIAILVLLAIKL